MQAIDVDGPILDDVSATDGPAAVSPLAVGYRRYAVAILLVGYTLSYLDRQIVTILAEPIKRDLGLHDWQLGAITGLAFALIYTTLGIPIARMAERANRPMIIGLSMIAWSGFTMLCGRVQSFVPLVLARVGVGFGEAGNVPCAHSLISDYTPKEKRASTLAVYSMGIPIGTIVGLSTGGLIADAYGWRVAFYVAGAPGALFGLLALITLPEPRKGLPITTTAGPSGSLRLTLHELSKKPSFWLTALGAGLIAFTGNGQAAFIAPFYFRVHGAELAQLSASVGLKQAGFLGLTLGLIQGTGGLLGAYIGGVLADRARKRDIGGYMRIPAISCLIGIPLHLSIYLAPTLWLSLALNGLTILVCSTWYGPVFAVAQSVVQPRSRATASAISMFILSVLGVGLGPITIGAISDLAAGPLHLGTVEGVRWALLMSPIALCVAAPSFFLAREAIRKDFVG